MLRTCVKFVHSHDCAICQRSLECACNFVRIIAKLWIMCEWICVIVSESWTTSQGASIQCCSQVQAIYSTWLFLHERILTFVFAKKQQAHCKNLEMWLDGLNYPITLLESTLHFHISISPRKWCANGDIEQVIVKNLFTAW